MKIVIIGSGNVATHLSSALKNTGNEIIQVYSKTEENARCLAEKLGCPYTTSVGEILSFADLYIYSVKDSALRDLACEVSEVLRYKECQDFTFIHTAGSINMTIMEGLAPHYGVLYPMQTFSKARKIDFRKVPCFIEASDEDTSKIINSLTASITDKLQECSSEKRKKMHLAAVFACNFTNHCYRLAEKVVEKENLDFGMFIPLIQETAGKVCEMSPKTAQTGPMVRWDTNVMDMQMGLIDDERTREIYRLMAKSIHDDRQ